MLLHSLSLCTFITNHPRISLYIRKLVLLSLAFDEYKVMGKFQSDEHRQKNERFLKLMVKTTNLVVIVVISSYFSMLILVLQLGHFMVMIDHSVIVLCVYLSYAHNARLYDKLCCAERSYRCCTVLCFLFADPKSIEDESLAVAIQENNGRHRFNSISHSLSLPRSRSLSASQSDNAKSVNADYENSKSLPQLSHPNGSNQSLARNGSNHLSPHMPTLEMKDSEHTAAESHDIDIDCIEMYDGMDEIRNTVALAPFSSATSNQPSPISRPTESIQGSTEEVISVQPPSLPAMLPVATHSEHPEVQQEHRDAMDMEIVLEDEEC